MRHAAENPADLHDPTAWGYSHTARVEGPASLVFVAGQFGSNSDGSVVSGAFAAQVEQAFANLETALRAHGLSLSDVVQLRTYVVGLDFDALGAITQAIKGHWPDTPPTQTVLGVAALATPEIRFEVEAVAAG